jgi:hypothetical protein
MRAELDKKAAALAKASSNSGGAGIQKGAKPARAKLFVAREAPAWKRATAEVVRAHYDAGAPRRGGVGAARSRGLDARVRACLCRGKGGKGTGRASPFFRCCCVDLSAF